MKNRKYYELQQAFAMPNNMALSGLWENVILTNIIPTSDGTIVCVKSDTWCKMVWHLIVGA